jgi:hypothetical protein
VPPGAGFAHTTACAQQSTAVHACIKASLPKYADTCCIKDVSDVSNMIRTLDAIATAGDRRKRAEEGSDQQQARKSSGAATGGNSVHVQWLVDEIPGEAAGAQPGTTHGSAALSPQYSGKKRAGLIDRKRKGGSTARGVQGVGVAVSQDEVRTWLLITVRKASGTEERGGGNRNASGVLAGAVPVESSRLHSVRQQVRLIRLRLEAHKEGTAGTLLQGIDSDDSQARHIHVFHACTVQSHRAKILKAVYLRTLGATNDVTFVGR